MDNRVHLHLKTDSQGLPAYWFSLSTDNYAMYLKTVSALENHGTIISRVVGQSFTQYHLAHGYRDFMVWGILSHKANINAFLGEIF